MRQAPFLTVIVPVYRGTAVLPKSLGALMQSDMPRDDWELIVVDDASPDETPIVAAQYADVLIRLAGKPRGPAYARNRGFEASRGEVIVFVDADVVVHADTLRKFAEYFRANPDIASVFGSYDLNPGGGVVSQFRNLMHHYVHHCNAGDAETFWAGCGAIRADAFAEVGMFDEWHFSRPQIEDIELGRRLRSHGFRIVLRPEIQGTHLKRWTFMNMVITDLQHRGVPWMWLLLTEGPSAGGEALNLRKIEKLATALVGAAGASALAALIFTSWWPLMFSLFFLLTVVVLNQDFYTYLRRQRTTLFALQSIPLHLCCYVVNGLSAFSGSVMHVLFGAPTPPNDVSAQAELGIKTWPPGPAKRRSTWDLQPTADSNDRVV
jgi:cellulose synthase/poly-beta-1,6-N-acetylglucosamine synthase-like glycosyltransferase